MMNTKAAGPLHGLRVIEMAGIGPGPLCGMMLADMGADVIRVDRLNGAGARSVHDFCGRGKRSVAIDIRQPQGKDAALALIDTADGLIEGFRPGVMERLGLGPDACLKRNPKLAYGRMTGWGQQGPLSHSAGHDANYISITGPLGAIGRRDQPPAIPLNLIGDYGGGGAFLALGLVSAMLHAARGGNGQVVDAAMTDGSALLMTMLYGLRASGAWSAERESNLLDGAAPFYDTYECKDGRYCAVGCIEPKFFEEFSQRAQIDLSPYGKQHDRTTWSAQKEAVRAHMLTKTRDEWVEMFEGSDACVTGVLDMDEAPLHPHNQARQTFVSAPGASAPTPAPAPRFSDSGSREVSLPPVVGADTQELLKDAGIDLKGLQDAGVIPS